MLVPFTQSRALLDGHLQYCQTKLSGWDTGKGKRDWKSETVYQIGTACRCRRIEGDTQPTVIGRAAEEEWQQGCGPRKPLVQSSTPAWGSDMSHSSLMQALAQLVC